MKAPFSVLILGVALAVTLLINGFAQASPLAGIIAASAVMFVSLHAAVPASAMSSKLCVSLGIPEHYVRVYQANWDHTVQQEVAKLRETVTVDTFPEKEKVYTDIDQVSFTEKKGRLEKTELKEITGQKRKLTKRSFTCSYIFDRQDNNFLAMLGEPDSELQMEMKFAFNRSIDLGVAEAASGTVYGGVDPHVTPITLGAGQQVAVNYVPDGGAPANSGLTPHKLMEAIRIIDNNNLSMTSESFVLVISPRQKQDLFAYVTTSPNDTYAAMIADWLKDNSKPLFGFRVIVSTSLTTTSGIRTCLAFSKRGIYMAPDKLEVKVVERPDIGFAKQITAMGEWGFMRRYEERVVEIYCDEDI